MNDYWVKFGCFLTGWKYSFLKQCSIASEQTLKKYTAAIVLMCMVWAFIGYAFTGKYIISNNNTLILLNGWLNLPCIAAAIIMVTAVIQIERQIVLGEKNKPAAAFRVIIGLLMALIGSIIIDQVLFHKDIQQADDPAIRAEALEASKLDSSNINKKMSELQLRNQYLQTQASVLNQPTYKVTQTSTTNLKSNKKDSDTVTTITQTKVPVQNPDSVRYNKLRADIQANEGVIDSLYQQLGAVYSNNYTEIKSNRGFLKEMDALYKVLFESYSHVALVVWLIFFTLFFSLELLVLAVKFFDKTNDYEEGIKYQMDIRIAQFNELRKIESTK